MLFLKGGACVDDMEVPGLPEFVLVMDSDGIVRLIGWPDDGIRVTKAQMERLLTFLVTSNCLSLDDEVDTAGLFDAADDSEDEE